MHRGEGMCRRRSSFNARLWFGILVLTLGLLWTLDNLGIIQSEEITRWWPLIIVGFGVLRLAGIGMERHPGIGIVFILVGGLFILDQFDIYNWDLSDLWPVALIVVGGMMAYRALRGPGGGGIHARIAGAERRAEGGGASQDDTFSCVAIWSGVDRRATSAALRGGDFTAIMGGGELDLRGAKAVEGGAEVEVLVIMGGLEILVPEDWNVVNEATVVMGAIEDERKVGVPAGANTLILKGFVMWGGVEIKN